MPQLLERMPRYLPRIVAYNENHDEAGRFAESDSAGGEGGGDSVQKALKDADTKTNMGEDRINALLEKLHAMKPAEVKQIAKDIGIFLSKESKAAVIEMLHQRIMSRFENALNTSFHPRGS